jgi:hypothetical protein
MGSIVGKDPPTQMRRFSNKLPLFRILIFFIWFRLSSSENRVRSPPMGGLKLLNSRLLLKLYPFCLL